MNKLIDKLKYGEYEVPGCVRARCNSFFKLAIIDVCIGIGFVILTKELIYLFIMILIALAFAAIGYLRMHNVTHNGYGYIRGECELIEYPATQRMLSSIITPKPSNFLVRNEMFDEELYYVPYSELSPPVSEGDMVAIYFRKNAKFTEYRGSNRADSVLGYEVVGRHRKYDA